MAGIIFALVFAAVALLHVVVLCHRKWEEATVHAFAIHQALSGIPFELADALMGVRAMWLLF